jgi:hypothetical protein
VESLKLKNSSKKDKKKIRILMKKVNEFINLVIKKGAWNIVKDLA